MVRLFLNNVISLPPTQCRELISKINIQGFNTVNTHEENIERQLATGPQIGQD